MASMLLKGVHKRLGLPSINISCSSADATSVVASTGPGSGSSRFIDRHSPRLRDPHRTSTSASTKPPRPSFGSDNTKDTPSSPSSNQQQHGHDSKKKKKSSTASAAGAANGGRRSSEKRLVSPATSSRFLLNSSRMQSDDLGVDMLALPPPPPPPTSFIDVFPGKDAPLPPWPVHFPEDKPSVVQVAESSSSGSSSASSSSEITAAPVDRDGHDQEEVMKRSSSTRRTQAGQVVVLRVSLHCKGCAGKVKKHIAKMEGVTSFDIDIASKKVTVVGDVTPLGVLNSVSKVKPAQFWPSSTPLTTFPPRASASF
ncbi:protein SODIUM POTASSIUM ROOT DEFECTIVE 1-like [Lolium rigidum]|uniref:protein SODIUM POTASSIUM ROOT DEFECTIVE 1-like n=1 Tax=Lolium rigidum TaxID=89674 RepID=UPI001F5CB1F9|nr:protein SODIUM POTASSIUM ROOT DEFECTIVE 1-like [Lolium rigidum]